MVDSISCCNIFRSENVMPHQHICHTLSISNHQMYVRNLVSDPNADTGQYRVYSQKMGAIFVFQRIEHILSRVVDVRWTICLRFILSGSRSFGYEPFPPTNQHPKRENRSARDCVCSLGHVCFETTQRISVRFSVWPK